MRVIGGIRGFLLFWYDFIIGDDWTVAASIAAALVLTAVLNRAGVASWWILPLTVIVAVGFSLRRARPAPPKAAPS
jgi:hypothetical protein